MQKQQHPWPFELLNFKVELLLSDNSFSSNEDTSTVGEKWWSQTNIITHIVQRLIVDFLTTTGICLSTLVEKDKDDNTVAISICSKAVNSGRTGSTSGLRV